MSGALWFLGGLAVPAAGWLGWRWRQKRSGSLRRRISEFFGGDPAAVPLHRRTFSAVELPNLQAAITAYAEKAGWSEVVGYSSQFGEFHNDLRTLIANDEAAVIGPVQHREVDIDVGQSMACVENGIHLIASAESRIAAHVRFNMMRGGLELEVMGWPAEAGSRFVDAVRAHAAEASVYRGKVLSLECDAEGWGRHGFANVRFHSLEPVTREDLVLPEETVERLERNTVSFFRHAETLRKSGRSGRRGLLLHGKPGTGKTLTARWLAQSLEGVTTILLSGEQLGLVKQCCQMARMLAPSLVVMEDVDLIAGQRDEQRHPAFQVTLHQLLNEMDGIGSEAAVIFLLTTNRPDVIEPAIAARPGRIDQAIEYPLPDPACRRRLLELYGRGLRLELEAPERIIERTEGASPAFIQELVRKAALIAAEEDSLDGDLLVVTDDDFDAALRELVLGGGDLTRNLLGFTSH